MHDTIDLVPTQNDLVRTKYVPLSVLTVLMFVHDLYLVCEYLT